MRSALAYSPRRGPLGQGGALAACAYLWSFALAALAFDNPIVIAGAGAAVAAAGMAAGARRALALAARWGLSLAALMVVVNGLVSGRGDTVVVYGIDLPPLARVITLESLAEGAVLGLRVAVLMVAFAVQTACVDPDSLLRLLRPLAARSALTATMIARMAPLAAADAARLRDAAALRGPAAAPAGRGALLQRLVAGSLDRALDAAATLELRGYAGTAPRSARGRRRSRHDPALWGVALAVGASVLAARLGGAGGFDPYPAVALDAGPATLALAAALPLLALVPFARDA